MLKYIIILLIFLQSILAHALDKDFTYGAMGGVVFGGPIPVKSADNYKGSPVFGPYFGMYFDFKLDNNFSFRPEISMSIKGVDYTGQFRRDTIVETKIDGQNGWVPTFYVAHISGNISLVYLDIPLLLTYNIAGSTKLFFGTQASILLGGSNPVKTRIVIGEGGFYNDSTLYLDGYQNVHPFEIGLCLGGSQKITEDLTFTFYGTRSFSPFYKAGTMQSNDIDTGNLYNTYFIVSISYLF
jgi:hypothetical protein